MAWKGFWHLNQSELAIERSTPWKCGVRRHDPKLWTPETGIPKNSESPGSDFLILDDWFRILRPKMAIEYRFQCRKPLCGLPSQPRRNRRFDHGLDNKGQIGANLPETAGIFRI